ncbi:TPA: hypothetical protein ACH3X1_000609 [Trebouxia sp. C0004]
MNSSKHSKGSPHRPLPDGAAFGTSSALADAGAPPRTTAHPAAARRLAMPRQTAFSLLAAAAVGVMAERSASKPEGGSQKHAEQATASSVSDEARC